MGVNGECRNQRSAAVTASNYRGISQADRGRTSRAQRHGAATAEAGAGSDCQLSITLHCRTCRRTVRYTEARRAAQGCRAAARQAGAGSDRQRTIDQVGIGDLASSDSRYTSITERDITRQCLIHKGCAVILQDLPAAKRADSQSVSL